MSVLCLPIEVRERERQATVDVKFQRADRHGPGGYILRDSKSKNGGKQPTFRQDAVSAKALLKKKERRKKVSYNKEVAFRREWMY